MMAMDTILAEVALEVAEYMPDGERFKSIPRAEWRWHIMDKALEIVRECQITEDSEDLDEIVNNYLSHEEALS